MSFTHHHDEGLIGFLRLSDYKVPPEPNLFDSVVGSEFCEMIFDEVLEQCDHEFGVFTDDLHVFW